MSAQYLLRLVALFSMLPWSIGCDGDIEGKLPSGPAPKASVAEPMGNGLPDNPEGIVRRVEIRNPIGVPADNLMVDGDFELSIAPSFAGGQYGWLAFNSTGGDTSIVGETGGLCRTGLRCVDLQQNQLLFGRATAAPNAPMEASMWTKPSEDVSCDSVSITVLSCDTFVVTGELQASESADQSGWCRHAALLPPQSEAPCFFIETTLIAGQSALIDSATLLSVGASSDMSAIARRPMDTARKTRINTVRDAVRRRQRFADPDPRRREPRAWSELR